MALPRGYENSDQNSKNVAPSPYQLKSMVQSTLTPNLQFPSDKMNAIKIDYNEGDGWITTTAYPKLPVLANGEELSWHLLNTEGVFNKKAKVLFAITNFRVLIYDFKNPHESGNIFLSDVEDILVMNSHRVSNSTRVGGFSSTGRYGMRVGTGGSSGTSVSQTVGDVVFMKDGEQFIVMSQMADPNGIARLAKSIKKSVQVRNSIENITIPDSFADSIVPKEELIEYARDFSDLSSNEMIKRTKALLQKYPDRILFLALVDKFQKTENWKEMEKESRDMLQRNNHEKAAECLCAALFNQDKTDEAINEMNKALTLYPNNPQFQIMREKVSKYLSAKSEVIICPKCKKENEKDSKFCKTCGGKIKEGCIKCGHINPKNAKFCNDCGFVLQ